MRRSNPDLLDRTTSSPELLVDLSTVPRGRRGAHLVVHLREALLAGTLRPGQRLPSSRALAADLGVSRGTVVDAYAQLCAEGHLRAQVGAGTVVAEQVRPATSLDPPAAEPPPLLDLAPGTPDLGAFPRREWARAAADAVRTLPDADLGYGDPGGLTELRVALAGYLGRVRGVSARPDQIVVVAGFAQALALLARALPAVGMDVIAVEDPGSAGAREQLEVGGMATPPVPVDEHGVRPAALPDGRAAVLLTPAHQFPSGAVLTADRRRELVEWARAGDRFLIEDDYDAEYRYDHAPIGAIQGLDPDRVVYGGSVSKTLAPGLRLGWLVLPEPLVGPVRRAKEVADLGAPALVQATFTRFLERGTYDAHIRRSRRRYRARRDVLVEALGRHLPGCTVRGAAAGLHLVLDLADDLDDVEVAAAAAQHGVGVQPLSRHRQRPGPPGLVLGYACRTPDELDRAAALLALAVADVAR